MAEHPTDRGVREMAMAPLLELSDERLLYGDPWGAFGLITLGREIAPHHDRLVIQESRIRRALGQPESAARLLERHRRRVWDITVLVPLNKALGNALYEAGDARGAIEAFEQAFAFRVPPTEKEERLRLAECYRSLGQDERAEAALKPLRDLGLP
jgi:tetratricopeptide (TPR) repeat protein